MGWAIFLLLFIGDSLLRGSLLSEKENLISLTIIAVIMMVIGIFLLFRHIKGKGANLRYGIFITLLLATGIAIMLAHGLGGNPAPQTATTPAESVFSPISALFTFAGWITLLVYLYKTRDKSKSPKRHFWDSPGTYGFSQKSCSRCGRQVSISSRAGQTCPHCGAYWSSESFR